MSATNKWKTRGDENNNNNNNNNIIDSGASANLLCEITFQAINSQKTITTSVLVVKTPSQLTSLFSEKGKKSVTRTSVAFFRGSKKTNCA